MAILSISDPISGIPGIPDIGAYPISGIPDIGYAPISVYHDIVRYRNQYRDIPISAHHAPISASGKVPDGRVQQDEHDTRKAILRMLHLEL